MAGNFSKLFREAKLKTHEEEIKITAQFNSRCTDCGGRVEEGETVWWTKGEGVRHDNCDGRDSDLFEPSPDDPSPDLWEQLLFGDKD